MIVFTNGVFDLLSVGHFNLLMFCREKAGFYGQVVVGVDEDDKVMADKGLHRPIYTSAERAKALYDLKFADQRLVNKVEFFHTNLELEMMIKRIKPDIIVKGSDWLGRKVVGSEVAKVVMFDRMQDYSTTEIIRRVMEKHGH